MRASPFRDVTQLVTVAWAQLHRTRRESHLSRRFGTNCCQPLKIVPIGFPEAPVTTNELCVVSKKGENLFSSQWRSEITLS